MGERGTIERVRWREGTTRVGRCPCCETSAECAILLEAAHWHHEREAVELAECPSCASAFFVDPNAHVAYPEHEADDPRFVLLLHHYIELVSGLSWKVPLLERLPHERFESVLEIGCSVGVALDYCATAWGADVVGLEPSAYGVGGRRLLGLPIHAAQLADCAAANRSFDFIFATEVLEHVERPLELLAEIFARLSPKGMLLLTVPTAEHVRKDAQPGELYATLSAGAHFFIPSERALRDMVRRVGFEHVERWVQGNSQVLVAGKSPFTLRDAPPYEAAARAHYEAKLRSPSPDRRVALSHAIDLYDVAIDRRALGAKLERALSEIFSLDLRDHAGLAARLRDANDLFDVGGAIPYGLPKLLLGHARYEESAYPHACIALVCAHGLRCDFQNMYLYHERLLWALAALKERAWDARTREVMREVREAIGRVSELKDVALPEPSARSSSARIRERWSELGRRLLRKLS